MQKKQYYVGVIVEKKTGVEPIIETTDYEAAIAYFCFVVARICLEKDLNVVMGETKANKIYATYSSHGSFIIDPKNQGERSHESLN